MQKQLKSFYCGEKGYSIVNVFSYNSKGLPGLEIIGVGKTGREIKEKFIFLSKTLGLRIPFKRYILGVEGKNLKELSRGEARWLEFPLLLCFWSLAGHLQIRLEDCLAAGQVSVTGKVIHLDLPLKICNLLHTEFSNQGFQRVKLISQNLPETPVSFGHISSEELLSDWPYFKFQTQAE